MTQAQTDDFNFKSAVHDWLAHCQHLIRTGKSIDEAVAQARAESDAGPGVWREIQKRLTLS